MANRYSVASGLASAPSTWDGGATVPGTGDRVLISATHTVELDGTFEWGDDTTNSIVVNSITTTASLWIEGTLKASRSANSQLTVNGGVKVHARSGVTGKYDAGTAADPIPLAVSHTLLLNKSAVLANNKYGFDAESSGTNIQAQVTLHGFLRRRNTTTLAALSAGDTSVNVNDAAGWQVGDQIIFGPTSAYNADDVMTILTITPVSGTIATITFAALTNAHALNCPVGNFTSNVTVSPYSTSGYAAMTLQTAFSATTGNIGAYHVCNVLFTSSGGSSSITNREAALVLFQNNVAATDNVYDTVSGLAFKLNGSGQSFSFQFMIFGARQRILGDDICVYNTSSAINCLLTGSNAVATLNNYVEYRTGISAFQTGFSQGSCNTIHTNCKSLGANSWSVKIDCGFAYTFIDSMFGANQAGTYFNIINTSNLLAERCDFGAALGRGGVTNVIAAALAIFCEMSAILRDCIFHSSVITRPLNYYRSLPTSIVTVENKNADVTLQEIHRPAGSFYRDNSVVNRGASSIRLEPDTLAGYAAGYSVQVFAPNGAAVTVIGYLRKNSSYGASTLPSVKLSGLGITPQTFTMTNSTDTWEKFSLTATQTSGVDGNLTLTFEGQSANAGAFAYFDGVVSLPFVLKARHYGYVFDSNPYRIVDSLIVSNEAAAAAMAGIAINFGTSTITISGQRSLRDIYDWCKYKAATNISVADFISSVDGVNFSIGMNLSLTSSGEITGAGSISLGAYALTMAAGAKSSAGITHSSGTKVWTRITVEGFIANSNVRIVNATASLQLFNGIVAASPYELQVEWDTADSLIDLQVAFCNGTTAKLEDKQRTLLGTTGASFLVSQSDDVVYNSNGIDGFGVTEFSADYAHVQVDLDDGDGMTTVQRGYAWYVANLMTANGIANYFGALTAEDAANYRINTGIVNLRIQNAGTNEALITGGRIYRDDGTPVAIAGTGPLQIEPGKAYIAQQLLPGTVIDSNVVKVANSNPIIGDGTRTNPWRPS